MSRSWSKFVLLSWKNWILQYRRPTQTIIEILAPVLFSILLVVIRSLVDPKDHDTVTYNRFCPLTVSAPPNISALNERNVTGIEGLRYLICDLKDHKQSTSIYEDAQNVLITQHILYTPNDTYTNNFMSWFDRYGLNLTQGFQNIQDLEDFYNSNASTLVAFEFGSLDPKNKGQDKDVKIRFPAELRNSTNALGSSDWATNLLYPLYQTGGPRNPDVNVGGSPSYQNELFLLTQQLITMALISYEKNVSGLEEFLILFELPYIYMERYPHYAWTEDVLLQALQSFVGIIVMLSFAYTCINTVKVITNEKEKQLKESMKIMGLSNWLHWTAWFVKSFIFLLVSVVLITILLKVKWYPNSKFSVFTYTDPSVLLIFFILYICSVITFCFATSVFFSKANTAATCGGLIWFVSYIPYLILQQRYDTLSLSEKLSTSLGMNSAMAYGFQVILMFEGTGEGSQWSNLFSSSSPDDTLTLGHIFTMLFIDSFIYLLIALYFEAIFPGEFGVPLPWYFPFTKWYWFGGSRSYAVTDSEIFLEKTGYFEADPNNMHAGVTIRNLRKVFDKNTAVKNLSLNMYQNQITVLLGHNGAGKTTTMSMLTGMFPPTSGTATINGYDIKTDMDKVRSSLGLCPQHNILFDDLTVNEHLYFYSKLKGMNFKAEINEEIAKYVKLLELEDKANSRSSTLSGGMKRKLCVGMALCGDSKVVMLDEPTAGMDPSARRALWELLQSQKEGRTMLLTTHFMDEADLLGDRIAIMAGGTLQCCGSSFFLKKKYGAGYNLILEKSPGCNPNEVKSVLKKYVPDIEINSNVGSELSFLLSEQYSPIFEKMFRDLESNSRKLGILSYGISLTTLEEVFMKVGADHGDEEETSDKVHQNGVAHINNNISTNVTIRNQEFLEGFDLVMNQYIAMFMKKFLSMWRSRVLQIISIFIPVLFLILVIVLSRTTQAKDLPALKLSADTYKVQDPVILLQANNYEGNLLENFKKLTSSSGTTISSPNITSALLELTKSSPTTARRQYLYGATFERKLIRSHITAWFNNDAYHTAPISLGFILNSAYQETVNTSAKINFINHPLPFTIASQFNKLIGGNSMGFSIAFNIGFGMTFVASYYILFVVREKVSKSKHLQFVSGAKVYVFWTTTFICDFCGFIVTALCIIITLAAFQEDGFSTADQLGRMFLILLCFGYAVLPLVFFASNFFEIPSTGFTRMTMFGIFAGVMAFMVIQIMAIPTLDLENVSKILHWIFLLVPHYALSTSIRDNFNTYAYGKLCEIAVDACTVTFPGTDCKENVCTHQPDYCCIDGDYFQWSSPGIGPNLVFMMMVGTVLFGIIIMRDYKIFSKLIYRITDRQVNLPIPVNDEDDDVAKEKLRIHSETEELFTENVLVLKDLTKYYNKFPAVNGLCLGAKEFECFGLLGVNGAGKTTTFKMMTGDVKPTYGEAWVKGLSIKQDMENVQKHIGYCPQFDALLDDLTARESITIFALLRGIKYGECPFIADKLSRDFDFHRHLDKQVKELSGGNKRKLSTAISLIGDPPVLYLDEPTTGMDPATKRYLWDALAAIRNNGKCIVLTSHSMEECEALCTRLAIMVNGNFKCLGSTQHLKSKFAEGYTLTIKIKKTATRDSMQHNSTHLIKNFIDKNFNRAQLREEHQELLTYYILDTSQPWSRMFGILEKGKEELNIEDYSLGQSSLEQVFLTFTKHQEEI